MALIFCVKEKNMLGKKCFLSLLISFVPLRLD
nr:MAG TPA: hypothetical protein [Caudoviricetes sp.]